MRPLTRHRDRATALLLAAFVLATPACAVGVADDNHGTLGGDVVVGSGTDRRLDAGNDSDGVPGIDLFAPILLPVVVIAAVGIADLVILPVSWPVSGKPFILSRLVWAHDPPRPAHAPEYDEAHPVPPAMPAPPAPEATPESWPPLPSSSEPRAQTPPRESHTAPDLNR